MVPGGAVLRAIVGVSLQFRFLVAAAAAVLAILGALRLSDAPLNTLPEFSEPTIEIQTEALGLSAEEVEDLITVNMEEILSGIAWVRTIRSKSIPGLSSTLLIFESGTNLLQARQLVQERLNTAYALPNVSKPPIMLQPLSTTSRAMLIGLSSKEISLTELSVLTRWTVVPKLLGVPGVANVAVWGLRSRQLQVQVDPHQLLAAGVTLDQIIETAGDSLWVSPLSFLEASTAGTGGWIDTPNQRLAIQHVQPIVSAKELAEVPIADSALRLGDVTQVVEDHPPLIGDAMINSEPGLLLVVEQFRATDVHELVQGVDAALQELSRGMPSIDIDASVFRATTFLDAATRNLGTAVVAGIGLAVVVLGVWFLSWRPALVGLAAITLSLLTAGLLLSLREAPIDTISLAGVVTALAVIISHVVIQLEIIMRRLRSSAGEARGDSADTVVLRASSEVSDPLVFTVLIVLVTVAPILLVGGPAGAFLSAPAVSYLMALVASAAIAVTVTPVLASVVLGNAVRGPREIRPAEWVRRNYRATLSRVLDEPRYAFAAAAVLTVVALALPPFMNWSPQPDFRERDVRISWDAAPGTSLPEMRRIITRASQELRSIAGVRSVAAHIGRAITGDQVIGVESGQLWVGIDRDADYDATLADIRETVRGYPGMVGEVESYLANRTNEAFSAEGDQIVVRVEGPDRQVLRSEAEKVAESLSRLAGIVDLRIDAEIESPHVVIKVDLAAAGRVGLKPGDVRRAAATIFAGLEVGNIYDQQKVFEVVVWGVPESRQSITALRELLIDTPNGGHVRLTDVADVEVQPTPQYIHREGIAQYVDIRAGLAGRNAEAVASEITAKLRSLEFPLEYHAVLLRDRAQRQIARSDFLVAGLAVAAAIYLLLHACFQSWRVASLFCLALPTALSGGVLAIAAMGGTVHLGSVAGLLAILSFAACHGIAIVRKYQRLEFDEGFARQQAVRDGSGPFVASAIGTAAAFLPALAMGGAPGLEIVHPMAAVLIAGLVTSGAAFLFVLPPLYLRFASQRFEIRLQRSVQHAAS